MKKHKSFKKGVASLYIVIFATIILSIITMSFVGIISSETYQTSNNDLSQSAYDSALAGVEDAKTALMFYHRCISQGYVANEAAESRSCPRQIYEMEQGIKDSSCDVVSKVLGRENTGEVIIQENNGNAADMDQAYTCVKIQEELYDYRSTLSDTERVRMVPLRSDEYADVSFIEVQWFQDGDRQDATTDVAVSGNVGSTEYAELPASTVTTDNKEQIPMLAVDIIQTDGDYFTLAELEVNNQANTGTDHASVFLHPTETPGTGVVHKADVLESSSKHEHGPIDANCGNTDGFKCRMKIEIPPTYRETKRAEATFFLRVTLPYGDPTTTFAIRMCKDEECSSDAGNVATFRGVQAQIDSTGRANELYRRIEVRAELVDNYYPYADYAVLSTGEGAQDFTKSFWITYNCWRADSGETSDCPNYGDV